MTGGRGRQMPRPCVLAAYSVAMTAPLVAVLMWGGSRHDGDWGATLAAVLLAWAWVAALAWLSVPLLSWAMRRWPWLANPRDRR